MLPCCFRTRFSIPILAVCFASFIVGLEARSASAAKIKMAFPGPATTFSLPYLVALKKGWLGDVQVEDVHVTGDANAMRVLLSGNADIALIGTLNVLASIHAGANVRAIHSWQPIGDYAWCSPGERATSLATLPARPSPRLVQAGYRTNCPAW